MIIISLMKRHVAYVTSYT